MFNVAECEVADREGQKVVGAGRHPSWGGRSLGRVLRHVGSCLHSERCVKNGFEGDKTKCREIRTLMPWSR